MKSKTLKKKLEKVALPHVYSSKENVCLKKIQEVDELFQRAAKTCMEEIWAYLMDDDIQKIRVWGMGGIGKTTIKKLVHNQLLKETEKFDIVIWITVSKEMNIIKLQNKIARAMKVTLDEDEDEQ
ncbi:probable disease resistance protein At1g61300 [Durio zibethinus]|uniref:Probable disease resistance protein At1g61300 n=1 Tax=Durio zibethinus TaxID=66656 RepID=A0A6P5Y6F7_DURZI|nr:probable disease resistance protein At1g61300 [Durio zibethinus]